MGNSDSKPGQLAGYSEDGFRSPERWSEMSKDVTLAAMEVETVSEALQQALDIVRSYTGWQLGHVYYRSDYQKKALISTSIWSAEDIFAWEAFCKATDAIDQDGGPELPAEALAQGKIVQHKQLQKAHYIRSKASQKCGLVSGIALPVTSGKEIAAVLEFFSTQTIQIDQALMGALSKIGSNLGRAVQRRQADVEIRASQKQLAEAQRIARLGSWEWDIQSNEIVFSDELYRIFGLQARQNPITFEDYLSLLHPDERAAVESTIQDALQNLGEFNFEHRILRAGEEIRYIHGHGKVILDRSGRPVRMIGTSQDVTEQKRFQEKLRASEELIRRIVKAAPFILWAIDNDGTVILVEGGELSAFDFAARDLVGKSIYDLLKARPDSLEHIQNAFAGQESVVEAQIEKDVYESRYAPYRDEKGAIIGVIGVLINIKERARMEAALRASEARFRAIFEGSALGIAMLDLDQRFLIANPAFQQISGYTNAELWGKELEGFVYAPDLSQKSFRLKAILSGEADLSSAELRFSSKDGQLVWVNATLSLVRKEDGSPRFAILMIEDISLRKQMEAELTEVQRRLVAGREQERLYLAQELHDDPLQELYGLLYHMEDIKQYLHSDEGLGEVQEAQQAINKIINTMRNISRDLRPPVLAPFGLGGAISELCDRFREDHPEINLQIEFDRNGRQLSEEARMTVFRILQQALTNVARHAQAKQVNVRFQNRKESVILEVEDDGVGFIVPARWVPLVRQGHLGLAGAAERAEAVNGRFQVISSPGKGTLIRLVIPEEQAKEQA